MVNIVSIGFTDEYTGSGATKSSFLLGSVGDKITATVVVAVSWSSLSTIVSYDSSTKTITRTDGISWLDCGFRTGDSFTIVGGTNAGNYTAASVTDTVITTNEALSSISEIDIDFHGTTPVNAADFYFNLIENQEALNFISKVDNQTTQKKTAGKTSWSAAETVSMTYATVSKGWDTGTGTIEKTSVASYIQTFTIVHTFLITPEFLSGQEQGLISSPLKPPSYFLDLKCLRYVCRFDAKFTATQPTIVHTTANNSENTFQNGNTGWYNEFLNKLPANYTLTSIAYKDVSTGDVVSQAQIGRDTEVTVVLNSVNSQFASTCPLVVNMMYCPLDTTDYINTPNTIMYQNFKHDRRLTTIGAATTNGENYGTAYQVIKDITATLNSATSCTVVFTVSLSPEIQDFLIAKDETNRNYIIWITPQDKDVTTLGDTDRNAVLCDFNNMSYDTDNETLLTFPEGASFYKFNDSTLCPYTDYKGFVQDGVVAKIPMIVKSPAKLLNCAVVIRAYNSSTDSSFDLERTTLNFSNLYSTNNEIPQTIAIQRGFKLPQTDPRNQVNFYRNTFYDDSTHFGYELDYGYKIRYEAWRQVPIFDTVFQADHSEDWSIYSLRAGWAVQFMIEANVEDSDGNVTTFQHICEHTIQNQNFSADGFGGTLTRVVETFIDNGGLVNTNGFIAQDFDTIVKMTITGAFTTFPSILTGYVGLLWLDVEATGGYTFIDQTTSEQAPISPGSIWKDQAVLTKVNNTTITIQATIDKTKLDPQVFRYLISGELAFKGCTSTTPDNKIFQNGDNFIFQNGNQYTFQ